MADFVLFSDESAYFELLISLSFERDLEELAGTVIAELDAVALVMTLLALLPAYI